MSQIKPLPIEETIKDFLDKRFPERPEMISYVRKEIWSSNATKYLIGELAEEAIKHGLKPTDCMGLSFIYGVVIGVLAERKENNQRIIRI